MRLYYQYTFIIYNLLTCKASLHSAIQHYNEQISCIYSTAKKYVQRTLTNLWDKILYTKWHR